MTRFFAAPKALASPPRTGRPRGLRRSRRRDRLDALAPSAAGFVALTPAWYMDDARSTLIAPDPEKTPADGAILAAAADARAHGFSVVIKPHVDVRDGTRRSEIEPRSRVAWFDAYERQLVHYAKLARKARATALVVGTELASMSGDESRWRGLIAVARVHFPGCLTYATNQPAEAERIGLWRELDLIGAGAYTRLVPAESGDARPLDRPRRSSVAHQAGASNPGASNPLGAPAWPPQPCFDGV